MTKTIAFVTDTHLDEQYPFDLGVDPGKNWETIIKDINSRKINEIIFGGDIGEPSAHEYFFDSFAGLSKELKIILGNHDAYEDVKKYFADNPLKNKEELFYSYEDSLFKYIFIDSSSGSVGPVQLNWMEDELRLTNKKKIIFIHHPVLQIDTPVDREFPLYNRKEIKNLLVKHKDEVIIFCGHYHMDDRTEVDNIKQYITPAASYQVIKGADSLEPDPNLFGYRIINFIDDQINTEVVLFEK